jgi:surfactin synthase thioesterase subunit
MSMLEREGYKCIGVNLASVGAEPPLKDMSEDVKAVRKAISSEVEQEHDVVVVVHSYGGVPGCEAIRGFTKEDQEAQGKKGGVVKLLFVCACELRSYVTLQLRMHANRHSRSARRRKSDGWSWGHSFAMV